MRFSHRSALFAQALSCWNWKCALLSATARSLVYLAAMTHARSGSRLAVVLVELLYVTLTAGLYAGLQQNALGLRSRLLGNLVIAGVVPACAQALDWLTHRIAEAAAPPKATIIVCVFTAISALFHLYVMRRGVFLTGRGSSLFADFQRVPRLIAGFVLRPFAIFLPLPLRLVRRSESESVL